MKRVFLTGGNGMVGRNLLNHSKSADYEFIYPSSKDLNLLNKNEVLDFMKRYQFDLVIHAAATVAGIHANIREPYKFFLDNLQMGTNVVLAAKEIGVKNLINLGSSCMYPKDIDGPIQENRLMSGYLEPTNEGYALGKITVAKLCQFISESDNNFKYKTLMPCNLYGKWDKFEPEKSHLIPSIISKIHSAKTNNIPYIEIWGDGKTRREFMFAEDLADAVYFCLKIFDKINCYTNVGMGYDLSVTEYFQQISDILHYEGKFIYDTSKPVGMRRKLVDNSVLTNLGWKPKYNLQEGVKITYEYYLNSINNSK
ncbi:GDP-L-fucose synthase family protein [Pigmentibacter ruber]